VIGAAFGSGQMNAYKPLLFSRPVIIGSAVVAVVAATMQFTNQVNAMFPSMPTLFLIDIPIDKSMLEPARLVSFFAIAILAARFMPAAAAMARFAMVRALARCGRHSLAIFCVGTLLAVPGHVIWMEAGRSLTLQMLFNFAGIALLIALAWLLDWMREGERAMPLPEQAAA
jgi:hypothetical protein